MRAGWFRSKAGAVPPAGAAAAAPAAALPRPPAGGVDAHSAIRRTPDRRRPPTAGGVPVRSRFFDLAVLLGHPRDKFAEERLPFLERRVGDLRRRAVHGALIGGDGAFDAGLEGRFPGEAGFDEIGPAFEILLRS